jgi:hypothetical protein
VKFPVRSNLAFFVLLCSCSHKVFYSLSAKLDVAAGHIAIEALMDRTLKEDVKTAFRPRVGSPPFFSSRLQTLNVRQSPTFLSFFGSYRRDR